MNYGLYLSASGVMVNAHRQDVLSNNLANVNTAGFKPMFTDVRQRPAEALEDGPVEYGLANAMLDRLGGGVVGDEQRIAFSPGTPIKSGNPLDAALAQENAFFVVEHVDPNTGEAGIRLTREGKFTRNSAGELITQAGHRVLNDGGQPIVLEADRALIQKSGFVRMFDNQGRPLGEEKLQVVSADLKNLKPEGKNLFRMTGGDSRVPIERPVLEPGHYESSGTNAIATMMEIVSATKAATGNAKMIQYQDQMLNASINTFARVA